VGDKQKFSTFVVFVSKCFSMKKFLIIKCGEAPALIRDQCGDYDDWIIKASGLGREYFKVQHIWQGEPLRHPDDFSATILTDSPYHPGQRFPWINLLKNWLITARYSNSPVLGIGFGFLIMAQALGAKISQNPNGPVLNTVFVNVDPRFSNDPLLQNTGGSFESYINFTRYPSLLPSDIEVLAKNSAGMPMIIRVNNLYGVFFRPELNESIYRMYIKESKLPARSFLGAKLASEYKNQSIVPNFLASI